MTDDEGLWVRSEVMPDGTYGVGLNVGADRSWALGRDQAIAYAVACHRKATEAEHDAAVFTLLTHRLGMSESDAADVLKTELHPERPDDPAATAPLRFTTAIVRNAAPFLRVDVDGREVGDLTPNDLRDHAGNVLHVLAAADLDATLRRVLVNIGIPTEKARAVIAGLAEHWPEERSAA